VGHPDLFEATPLALPAAGRPPVVPTRRPLAVFPDVAGVIVGPPFGGELGIDARLVPKVSTGDRALLEMLEQGEVRLVLNTPFGSGTRTDGYEDPSPSVRPQPSRFGSYMGDECAQNVGHYRFSPSL
jgi:hypothetical protein